MLMEGQVNRFSSQNSAGVSQEKDAALISQTTEVNGDQDSNVKKIHNKNIKCLHTTCVVCDFQTILCPGASTYQVVLKNVTDAMFSTSLFTVA